MYMIIGGDGKEYGPKPDSEVREWIAEGRLNAQSQIRGQSDADWRILGDLSEFAGDLFGATPSAPATPTPSALKLDTALSIVVYVLCQRNVF